MENNIYLKVQEIESKIRAEKSEKYEALMSAYQNACDIEDFNEAARLVRRIRDVLLSESDSVMSFDRFGLTVPSGSTFTTWLSFLRKLGDVLNSPWANYRQALRDLPQQEGFPFNVVFPEKPSEI